MTIKRVTLIKEDNVVLKMKEDAEPFKSYFETLVENLGMNIKFLSEEPGTNKSVEDVGWKITSLDASMALQQNDIPIKIIKGNRHIFSEFIIHNSNEGIATARFLDILKSAEIKPVFKKKSKIDKENYRPVSILPVISKTSERLIFKQIIMFFEPVFLNISADLGRVIVNNTVYSL